MTSGTYDPALVSLSILVATAASYTALDLASRARAAATRENWSGWLAAAAFAMGGGIWSMHFVAMLAFSIPGMPMGYHVGITLFSLLIAIAVTGIAFVVVARFGARSWSLILSGLLMGLGIAGMHYTGMAAMRMPASLSYDPTWVAISIFIAVGAATTALWVSFVRTGALQRALASTFMGGAIAGMHYAGMMAATYLPSTAPHAMHDMADINPVGLAGGVAITTFFVLALGLVASVADRRFAILAAKEAEALRASEERFRSLYRETPVPLFSMDTAGRITEVSDSAASLLKTSRNEAIGCDLGDFMTPASASVWRGALHRLSTEGGRIEQEYRFRSDGSGELDVMTSVQVFTGTDQTFVLGGLIDVTARNRAEAALRQSQKLEAVGQLTGGVAHDFNNLLAVITGSLEVLSRRLDRESPLHRLVDAAMEAGTRGATLTQRMLSFARKQQLDSRPVDMNALVIGIHDLLQRSVGPFHRIETNLPSQHVFVMADAHQLELALLNLVVNARDATGEAGSVVITVEERERAVGYENEPRRYAVLSVADRGTGMDADTLAKAAEPFFTTKGVSKGTGLGLSMVHGFVEQSSGWLNIQSAPGQGTTVEIWLIAIDAQEDRMSPVENRLIVSGKFRILAVDDDPLVLFSTVSMLEELGHSVVSAASGQDALSVLAGDRSFDVIITDQGMPGMTGLEFAREVRQAGLETPVLVASGYADIPERGALPILRKPFGSDELAEALNHMVARSAA